MLVNVGADKLAKVEVDLKHANLEEQVFLKTSWLKVKNEWLRHEGGWENSYKI